MQCPLSFAWEDAGAHLRWELPGALDASSHSVLSLRMLAVHDDPLNPPEGGLDLSVRLTDAAGRSATQPLSSAPGGALGATPQWLDRTVPKSVFESRRLPLHAFVAEEPWLDLSRLIEVSLHFDRSASGRIVLDDLELAPGRACE